jgi:tryptophan synthase alpha subunit
MDTKKIKSFVVLFLVVTAGVIVGSAAYKCIETRRAKKEQKEAKTNEK